MADKPATHDASGNPVPNFVVPKPDTHIKDPETGATEAVYGDVKTPIGGADPAAAEQLKRAVNNANKKYSSDPREAELQRTIQQNQGDSKKDIARRKAAKAELQALYAERDAAIRAAADKQAAIEGDAKLKASRAAENKAKTAAANANKGSTGSSSITSIQQATDTTDYSKRQADESVDQYRARVGGRGTYIEADGGRFSGGKTGSQASGTRQAYLNSITNSFSDLNTDESRSRGVREYNVEEGRGAVIDTRTGEVFDVSADTVTQRYTVAPNRLPSPIDGQGADLDEGQYLASDAAYSLYTLKAKRGGDTAGLFDFYKQELNRAELLEAGVPAYQVDQLQKNNFVPIMPSIEYRPAEQNIYKFSGSSEGEDNANVPSDRADNRLASNSDFYNLGVKASPFSETATNQLSKASFSQKIAFGIGASRSLLGLPIDVAKGVGKQLIVNPYNTVKYQVSQIGVEKGSPQRIQNLNAFLTSQGKFAQDPDVKTALVAEAFTVAAIAGPQVLTAVTPLSATASTAVFELGLGALGAKATYDSAKETIKNPTYANIGATAILGIGSFAGLKKGTQGAAREAIYLTKEKVGAETVFGAETQPLGGNQKFPLTSSVESSLADFEATRTMGRPETQGYIKAVTSAPQPLKSNAITGNVVSADVVPRGIRGPIESTGINTGAYGRGSPEFLKIGAESQGVKLSILPSFSEGIPTGSVILAQSIKTVPKNIANQIGYVPEAAFLKSQANTGTLFIPKRSLLSIDPAIRDPLAGMGKARGYRLGTTELQANVPVGSELLLLKKPSLLGRVAGFSYGFDQYTIVQGQKVPLPEFLLQGSQKASSAEIGLIPQASVAQSRRAVNQMRGSSSRSRARTVSPVYGRPSSSYSRNTFSQPSRSVVYMDSSRTVNIIPSATPISSPASSQESLVSQLSSKAREIVSKRRPSRTSTPSRTSSTSSGGSSYSDIYDVRSLSQGSSRPSRPSTPLRPSNPSLLRPPTRSPEKKEGEKKRQVQKRRQPKEIFKPSIVALTQNIEGTVTPGRYESGLGFRPLPKGTLGALKQAKSDFTDYIFKRKK